MAANAEKYTPSFREFFRTLPKGQETEKHLGGTLGMIGQVWANPESRKLIADYFGQRIHEVPVLRDVFLRNYEIREQLAQGQATQMKEQQKALRGVVDKYREVPLPDFVHRESLLTGFSGVSAKGEHYAPVDAISHALLSIFGTRAQAMIGIAHEAIHELDTAVWRHEQVRKK